jgi:hypothetical protein
MTQKVGLERHRHGFVHQLGDGNADLVIGQRFQRGKPANQWLKHVESLWFLPPKRKGTIVFELEAWNFSGCWMLEFGASAFHLRILLSFPNFPHAFPHAPRVY